MSTNLASINNHFNINVFLSNVFTLEIFHNDLLRGKTKEYEEKNPIIKLREWLCFINRC